MKFDRTTAEELLNALVRFSRDGINQYGRLSVRAGASANWNDKKSMEYTAAVQQVNTSMKSAFAAIDQYKDHFAHKVEELK